VSQIFGDDFFLMLKFLSKALQGDKERGYFEGIPRPAGKYSYGLTDTYTSRLFGLAGLFMVLDT